MRAFLFALLSAVALVLGACNEGGDTTPVQPLPAPAPGPSAQRTDLLYCYYGTWEGQEAAVRSHTNCGWAGPQWGKGDDIVARRLTELRDAGNKCVILDVLQAYDADAEMAIRAYFNALNARGLIGPYICALYPADEPDGSGKSAEEVDAANALVRRIAADYPFIAHIPLYTIYTCHGGFPGVESVDWASVDDYNSHEGVIARCIEPLRQRLRPDQRLWLTPGGFQCDNPQPFLDYANTHPQVLGFTVFAWFKNWGGGGEQGVENAPCRQSYVNAGMAVKGAT